MILLVLNSSICWCQNNVIPSTGEVVKDTVLVSLDAIKTANVKMLELKYEKEINKRYSDIIKVDSALINDLHNNILACELDKEQKIKAIKKERNIAIIAGSTASTLFLILFILAL